MTKFLLTTLTLAALAGPATAAHAVGVPAQVQSNSVTGMTYNGSNADNKTTITLSGSTFLVDDSEPLQINAGCVAVPGDTTKAKCTAVKNADGSFRVFQAFGQGGSDTITNSTPVGMIAFGADGADTLIGGPARDQLLGGNGDNDRVKGGGGDDSLSGGPGVHDLATYADKTSGVHAVLKDDTFTTGNGVLATHENDTINADIEDLGGGTAGDFLVGNSVGNVLAGGSGDDTLQGNRGADELIGGNDNDLLLSNAEIFGGPLFDGAADILNGTAGQDTCGGFASEGDTKVKCEF